MTQSREEQFDKNSLLLATNINITYADDSIYNRHRKQTTKSPESVVKENEKKCLNINCK